VTADLTAARRRFAETIGAHAGLPAALVEAFATVPREHFLDPGPWCVWGEGDTAPRTTPDDDPANVYVNASIAIDRARQLFNGLPSFLGMTIAALELQPGHRVLHVGPGLGYYSAVMGEMVRPGGSVLAVEVDPGLAARARSLVRPDSPVDVREGNGAGPFTGSFDAILVNAGVTHPDTAWLDALAPGGRLALPLTADMPLMGTRIGKGFMMLLTREDDRDFTARTLSIVAIYSALGLRDDAIGTQLAAALRWRPSPSVTRLTRRPHPQSETCFLHTPDWCLKA